MTNDDTLNGYLYALQNLATDLNNLAGDIRGNINGLGEDRCANSLESIAGSYNTIVSKIVNAYYSDMSNNG